MGKTAVIYWSGIGNTAAMALEIAAGAGTEVFSVDAFKGSVGDFEKIALGCPAMGDEIKEKLPAKRMGKGLRRFNAGGKLDLRH